MLVICEPLSFGHEQNDPVDLVFGFAATDHSSHLDLMAELANFLGDESKVNSLRLASDLAELRSLLV